MAWRLGVWFAVLLYTGAVRAECEAIPNPVVPLVQQLEGDTRPVFKKLGISDLLGEAPDLERPEKEKLIVPGKRAGVYELGMSEKALGALVKLSQAERKNEAEYEKVLPLSYIPERVFRFDPKRDFRFAFTADTGRLAEIFVRTDQYATAEGFRVGSTRGELKRLDRPQNRSGAGKRTYLLSDGITFVLDGDRVVEVIVRR